MRRVTLAVMVLVAFGAGCLMCDTLFAAPVTMRVSIGTPEHHFIAKAYAEWARLIEENSKGEIKVQVYYSAQLFRVNEVVKAIQTGAIEAGCAYAMYMQNQLVSSMKVLQMPFLFRTLEEALKVLHSEPGEMMKKVAEQKGVMLLGIVSFPSPDGEGLITNKPAKVPADVKGMVLRAVSPEIAAMMKKWGAGPSFLTGAEVYMALQRGTLHGAINSVSNLVERKLYEVAPYMVMLPYASVHTYLAVNKGFFDRLSPAQRKAIVDASNVVDKNNYGYVMKVMAADLEEAKKKATIYFPTAQELAKWKEGSEEVWEQTAKGNKEVAEVLTKVRAALKR